MLKTLKNNGFASLAEVIVTSVVFLIAAFGIISTISMLKPQESSSSQKLEAAYVAKGILDELRGNVDASTWNDSSSPLYCDGINTKTYTKSVTASGQTYNISYIVSPDPLNNGARQVNMTISY